MQISTFINNNTPAVITISATLIVLLFAFAGLIASRIFQSIRQHDKEMETLLKQRNALALKSIQDTIELQAILDRHASRQVINIFSHGGITPSYNSTLSKIKQLMEETPNENHPHFIALNFV